jgi:hypothetical protein
MSEIVEFYSGRKKDWRGRKIEDIWAYSHDQLESIHHFIQWLFPLWTPGVAAAPLLDAETVEEFRADAGLRDRLLKSFDVMLEFYGLRREGEAVVRGRNYLERANNWLVPGDHNFLRITRILTCLRELGLEAWSRAFLRCLEGIYAEHSRDIGEVSMRFWRNAASG